MSVITSEQFNWWTNIIISTQHTGAKVGELKYFLYHEKIVNVKRNWK